MSSTPLCLNDETVLCSSCGEHEDISIKEGEILKITPNGTTERSAFSYTGYCGRNWWDYGFYGEDYLTELKSVSSYYGYSPDDIDELAECGFTPEEIEEYLYCGGEV